jgi:hypothetical protein
VRRVSCLMFGWVEPTQCAFANCRQLYDGRCSCTPWPASNQSPPRTSKHGRNSCSQLAISPFYR